MKEWRWVGALAVLAASFSANADTRIEQVWTCTLNDDKTLEDLNAFHAKWIAWANKQPYGGDISGEVAGTLISSSFMVLIIDSYPDMATLAADYEVYGNTKESETIDAEYNDVSTCTGTALYTVMNSAVD